MQGWLVARALNPRRLRCRSGARGGAGGRLAPGEKRKLKRARVQAKRAARAEARGFDFCAVDGRLAHFVVTGGDMMVRIA